MSYTDDLRAEVGKLFKQNLRLSQETAELRERAETAERALAETQKTHARCPDYYVGGAGPKGVIEVHPQYEEGEWE